MIALTKNSFLHRAAASALLFVLSTNLFAYNLLGSSWQNSTAHYDLASSSKTYDVAFIEAMKKWNLKSNFSFTRATAGIFDPCASNPDRKNSYRFSNNYCGKGWNGSTLAVTVTWSSGGNTIDTDIVFNSNHKWGIHNGSNNSANGTDFRRVAVHELGHALGLGHESNKAAIMKPFITNDIINPLADDLNGLRAIYGGGLTTGDDLFVLNSSLSSASVTQGGSIQAKTEQHYDGSSASNLNAHVGFYLSGDTRLNNSDTLLGEQVSSLNNSNTVDSISKALKIPASTAPGSYYILFVADHNDRFPETNESNNTQAAAISVTTSTKPQQTLSVSVTGSGTISSTPSGINCPSNCSQKFDKGSQVSLVPHPKAGWAFRAWSGACSGAGACSVSMGSDKSVKAVFAKVTATEQKKLTVYITGAGSLSSTPAGINCPSKCSQKFDRGTKISLKPQAKAGWAFKAWRGACTGAGACNITLNSNKSVHATFVRSAATLKTLTVYLSGAGSVSSTPAGINCSSRKCSHQYSLGTVVKLKAQPKSGWAFKTWRGACTGSGACSVTIKSNRSVSATFTRAK